MYRFLKKYIQMIAEQREIELTAKESQVIVNALDNDDAIWDLLDRKVNQQLDILIKTKKGE